MPSNFSYLENEFPILFNICQAAEFNLHQDAITCLFKLADKIKNQYQSLKVKIDLLPQAILNKSFKGEFVEQEPNNEPIVVLLERVRGKIFTEKLGNRVAELQIPFDKKSESQTAPRRDG